MIIQFHRKFHKAIKNQPREIQIKFKEKLRLFKLDQFHPLVNNHALTGKLKGLRSFSVTGDVRVHYEQHDDSIILIDIGSHSELY